MNTQQDLLAAERDSSLFVDVLRELRRSRLLIIVTAVLTLAMTILTVALVGEPYSATAVVAPRAAESRGLELGSLASLSELAGGGRRPIFEEFVYLLSSDATARQLLTEKNSLTETLLKRAAQRPFLRRSYYAVQNLMRTLAGRKSRQPSAFEDAARQVRGSIETKKTPEGYITITVSGRYPEEAKAVLDGVVRTADELIRIRERAAYGERLSTLLSMAEKSTRPTEKVAISSAIDRDFARYVSSLGSDAFAYQYVVASRAEAQPRYVNGVLVMIVWGFIATCGLIAFVLLRARLRR